MTVDTEFRKVRRPVRAAGQPAQGSLLKHRRKWQFCNSPAHGGDSPPAIIARNIALRIDGTAERQERMLRASDVIFGILGVAVIVMLSMHMAVIVFALVGAFACGSIYVFAGMIPPRTEGFWNRAFISVFLALVLSSIVLIMPGTFGVQRPDMQQPVLAIAALLPLTAFCFEVLRTPRVASSLLRWFARRQF